MATDPNLRRTRPLRNTYTHTLCGSMTTIDPNTAENFAAQPGFFIAAYCSQCDAYFPLNDNGFVWTDGMPVGS